MADVFVSYKKEEHSMAERVIALVEAAGYSVWWDQDLTPRTSWDAEIEREIAAAKAVLVLWTPKSVDEKSFVRKEAAYAQDHGKLVPAMLVKCELPLRFRDTQTANLVGWDQRDSAHPEWQRVVEWIASTVSMKQTAGSTPARSDDAHQSGMGYLKIEYTRAALFAGPDAHIVWNDERLGAVRDGESKLFALPTTMGVLQIGFGWLLTNSHLSSGVEIDTSGREVKFRFRMTKLTMQTQILYWIDGIQGEQFLTLNKSTSRFQPLKN